MTPKTIFELRNVSYAYESHAALTDITLNVAQGEKIAFLGANGSGKSTLLQLLDGLLLATSGDFFAFGERMDREYFRTRENEYRFRSRVGYVFQDSDVQLFCATVWDEVTFAPLSMGLSRDAVEKQAGSALRIMNIGHLSNRIPYELSGGEKKRVAIASVLSYRPSVWLFDEPTAGLDPRSQSSLIDFIFSIRKDTNTVITATHDLSILPEIARRVIVISQDHRIVADTTPAAILKNLPFLEKHNLIHLHKHRHNGKTHDHMHIHADSKGNTV